MLPCTGPTKVPIAQIMHIFSSLCNKILDFCTDLYSCFIDSPLQGIVIHLTNSGGADKIIVKRSHVCQCHLLSVAAVTSACGNKLVSLANRLIC